mmetsp:Transcript_40232/g.95589  ORF Transcript_40232/g.95589 Transcript_40232/m.95589 type:complete len:263 (+) Transcript_40232:131-919(+)
MKGDRRAFVGPEIEGEQSRFHPPLQPLVPAVLHWLLRRVPRDQQKRQRVRGADSRRRRLRADKRVGDEERLGRLVHEGDLHERPGAPQREAEGLGDKLAGPQGSVPPNHVDALGEHAEHAHRQLQGEAPLPGGDPHVRLPARPSKRTDKDFVLHGVGRVHDVLHRAELALELPEQPEALLRGGHRRVHPEPPARHPHHRHADVDHDVDGAVRLLKAPHPSRDELLAHRLAQRIRLQREHPPPRVHPLLAVWAPLTGFHATSG